MVHYSLKVDRHALRNKFDLHQRTCLCDTHVSLVPVRTKCAFATVSHLRVAVVEQCRQRPKVRHQARFARCCDVAQSGYRRDSIITGAHETSGARSPIVSYVHKRSTRTRNQARLSSWRSVCRRTDYYGEFSTLLGDKTTPGPVVKCISKTRNCVTANLTIHSAIMLRMSPYGCYESLYITVWFC